MVTGTPKPVVYWLLEASESNEMKMIMPGTRSDNMYVNSEGTLKIEEPGVDNTGHYVCTALNIVGSALARSHLVVYDPKDFENGTHLNFYESLSRQ